MVNARVMSLEVFLGDLLALRFSVQVGRAPWGFPLPWESRLEPEHKAPVSLAPQGSGNPKFLEKIIREEFRRVRESEGQRITSNNVDNQPKRENGV